MASGTEQKTLGITMNKKLSDKNIALIRDCCEANPKATLGLLSSLIKLSPSTIAKYRSNKHIIIKCAREGCNSLFIKKSNSYIVAMTVDPCLKILRELCCLIGKIKKAIIVKYSRRLDDYWKSLKKIT